MLADQIKYSLGWGRTISRSVRGGNHPRACRLRNTEGQARTKLSGRAFRITKAEKTQVCKGAAGESSPSLPLSVSRRGCRLSHINPSPHSLKTASSPHRCWHPPFGVELSLSPPRSCLLSLAVPSCLPAFLPSFLPSVRPSVRPSCARSLSLSLSLSLSFSLSLSRSLSVCLTLSASLSLSLSIAQTPALSSETRLLRCNSCRRTSVRRLGGGSFAVLDVYRAWPQLQRRRRGSEAP